MRHVAFLIATLLSASAAFALDVGEQAPSLKSVIWVKGSAVEPTGKITVVEFWATWCGPCIKNIPHLTELQKKYGEEVQIVGLSNEKKDKVEPFVEKMGDKMDYHVGMADEETHNAYMEKVNGIPHAFLVDKSGKVVWEGHPASMGGPLSQLVAGNFDAEKFAKISAIENELDQCLRSRDYKSAVEKCDKILALDGYHQNANTMRMRLGKALKDNNIIRETLSNISIDGMPADLANSIAWNRLTDDSLETRHLDLLGPMLEHAVKEDPNNAGLLDTQARYFYLIGKIDQAIATQEAASKAASESEKDAYTANVKYYKDIKAMSAK